MIIVWTTRKNFILVHLFAGEGGGGGGGPGYRIPPLPRGTVRDEAQCLDRRWNDAKYVVFEV